MFEGVVLLGLIALGLTQNQVGFNAWASSSNGTAQPLEGLHLVAAA